MMQTVFIDVGGSHSMIYTLQIVILILFYLHRMALYRVSIIDTYSKSLVTVCNTYTVSNVINTPEVHSLMNEQNPVFLRNMTKNFDYYLGCVSDRKDIVALSPDRPWGGHQLLPVKIPIVHGSINQTNSISK